MSLTATRVIASRALARRAPVKEQKRGIVDYLTNYPDRVNEMKKIQCAGGTLRGEANPTWLKQSNDKAVFGFGLALVAVGTTRVLVGFYNLAFNKGKMED